MKPVLHRAFSAAVALLLLAGCGRNDAAVSGLDSQGAPRLPIFNLPLSFTTMWSPPHADEQDLRRMITPHTNLFEAAAGAKAAYQGQRIKLACPRGDRNQLVGPQRTIVLKFYMMLATGPYLVETVAAPVGNCTGVYPYNLPPPPDSGLGTLTANVAIMYDDPFRVDVQVYGRQTDGFPLLREGSTGTYAFASDGSSRILPSVSLWQAAN